MSTSNANANHIQAATEVSGTDVKRMMDEVLQHISDADIRNAALLRQMQDRLEILGHEARLTRPQVPNEYLPGFNRIEDGMSLLAARIAQSYSDRIPSNIAPQQPDRAPAYIPLTTHRETSHIETPHYEPTPAETFEVAGHQTLSAAGLTLPKADRTALRDDQPNPLSTSISAPGQLRPRSTSNTSTVDTFDVIESLPGNPIEPWSDEQADALSDHYATSGAMFAQAPIPFDAHPSTLPLSAQAAPVSAIHMASEDRSWLDQRLTDIAARVEHSLAAARSDVSLTSMKTGSATSSNA